jgi:predicted tellurium resistance membrane protein TerC/nicotinamide riboside kinase
VRPLKVVVTGSECTGKTTLARSLAARFEAPYVPEFCRGYQDALGRPLDEGDVEPIARGQVAEADAAEARATRLLVLDTDLVSTVVYARHYYGRCPAWVEEAARERRADLYLLCAPDLPWKADGQRDRGDRRDEMHRLFAGALAELGAEVRLVAGPGPGRESDATAAVSGACRALSRSPRPVRLRQPDCERKMDWISDPQGWIAFLTLAGLELVLGIDNIVFISILVGKLPKERQQGAYRIGLGLALFSRVLLLLSISWVMGLTKPLFTLLGNEVSGRDLVLIVGGLFLVAKSTHEIHDKLEGAQGENSTRAFGSYGAVLAQIVALDLIFSLDSVITAVGMVNKVGLMVSAIVVSIFVMMFFAQAIGDFVHEQPSIKMLACLSLMIGVMLIADGLDTSRGSSTFPWPSRSSSRC